MVARRGSSPESGELVAMLRRPVREEIVHIQHGVCQNVLELDGDGRPRMGWCFIPEGNLVPAM